MKVITATEAPAFETPNAVMRTYASPSLTQSPVAVWRAEMAAGAAGPWHAVDTAQVVVVLEGEATIATGVGEQVVATGDAVVLAGGEERRIENRGAALLVTLTCAPPGATATARHKEPTALPWGR